MAETQWAVSTLQVKKKTYIRNMNVFVPKQKPNHIAGTVSRAFNLTANHTDCLLISKASSYFALAWL